MKLYNTIIVWDCYATAESPEAARAALLEFIQAGEIQPSEQTALTVTQERSIREAWRNEKPVVGADVSDADFETLKGKTTLDVFKMLHTQAPPEAPITVETAKPKRGGAK